MQDKNTIIIAVVAVIVIVGGYFLFMGNNNNTSTPVQNVSTATPVDNQAESTTSVESTTSADKESLAPGSMSSSSKAVAVNIKVDAFMYGYTPKEIRVKKGSAVTINLTSSDGFHDWVVDEFNAKTSRINTGGSTSVTFIADKAGTFEYYCSVGDHRAKGMVGKLIVE